MKKQLLKKPLEKLNIVSNDKLRLSNHENLFDNTDMVEFKLFNPQGKEDWAEDFDANQAVEIYINGKEIIEILKEIETPYAMSEGHVDIAGAYGHLTPKQLYSELTDTDESALLCCDGCGFTGCWSVLVKVEEDDNYIYWKNFRHNHRDWKYDISYKFGRIEYENAVKQLVEHMKVI